MDAPIRVLIVDDHQMFREGVRNRLEQEPDMEVVGEAGSAEEVLSLMREVAPTVAIVDIRMPNTNGIELARTMRERWPDLKIMALTGYDFEQYVRALARVGVEGYILKDAPQDELVQALREVAAGGAVLSPKIASTVMHSYSMLSSEATGLRGELTIREIEVMDLMFQGLKNTEIAQGLSISSRTVEAHVSNIMAKLGANDRGDAIRIAVQNKLIK